MASGSVDQGWAWFVMLGSFVNFFLAISFIRAQSILLSAWIDYYKAPVTLTTLAFGISEIAESLVNLMVPAVLLPRFSFRAITVTGSLLATASILGLAYTSDLYLLNVLFFLLGAARGLFFSPANIILGYYFQKRLGFANGFAHAGVSMATIVMPVLTQFFIETFGLWGTLMLLAGMQLNSLPASMLFRTPGDWDGAERKGFALDVEKIGSDEGQSLVSSENEIGEKETYACSFFELKQNTMRSGVETSMEKASSPPMSHTFDRSIYKINPNGSAPIDQGTDFDFKKSVDSNLINKTQCDGVLDVNVANSLEFNPPYVPPDAQSQTGLHSPTLYSQSNPSSEEPIADHSDLEHDDCECSCMIQNSDNGNGDVSRTKPSSCRDHSQHNVLEVEVCIPCAQDDTLENNSDLEDNNSVHVSQAQVAWNKASVQNHVHKACPTSPRGHDPENFDHKETINLNIATDASYLDTTRHLSIGGDKGGSVSDDKELSDPIHSEEQKKSVGFGWLLKTPVAMVIVIGAGVGVHTQGSAVFMAVLGRENGVATALQPWLLTVAGVCEIVGKLCLGQLVDHGFLSPISLACITQTIAGTVYQLTWFYQGQGPMMAMAVVSGLTAGILPTMLTVMTIKTLGRSALGHVFGSYFLVSGLVTFLMQVVVGLIKDTTGSFRGGYNFIGALMIASVFVFSLKPLVQGKRVNVGK